MLNLKNARRYAITTGVVAMLAIGGATTAFAADSVTQTVNGGSLSASIADLPLTAVEYSHTDQTNTGSMTLNADDSTGTGDGWNVTVLASDFTDTASNTVAASNFSITAVNTPTTVEGQAIDGTGGPRVGTGGTLEQTRMVLDAGAGFGKGNYNQVLDTSLTIPGQTLAGTYTSNLTVSITAGPGGAS